MEKPNIGVVIITYNRVDDTRINMEIVRNYWAPYFEDIKIVHTYNGKEEWYPEKYLEDDLVRIENRGHFQGAVDLIESGLSLIHEKYKDIKYAVFLSADTWCVKPGYIQAVIAEMQEEELFLATAAWGKRRHNNIWKVGMALDFFILDAPWSFEYGFIPTHYKEFAETYKTLLVYESHDVYAENLFWVRFHEAVEKYLGDFFIDNQRRRITESYMRRMYEREPVHRTFFDKHGGRKMYFKKIGLITHHEPNSKKQLLRKYNIRKGENIQKLLNSSGLGYYNNGFVESLYSKNKQKRL